MPFQNCNRLTDCRNQIRPTEEGTARHPLLHNFATFGFSGTSMKEHEMHCGATKSLLGIKIKALQSEQTLSGIESMINP